MEKLSFKKWYRDFIRLFKKETKISSQLFGPNEEAISAFVLKYRLFIQDKDDISIKNMGDLYSELLLDNSYYEKYNSHKKRSMKFWTGYQAF